MIAVIINPIAGGARAGAASDRVNLASQVLAAHGEPSDISITERRGHARELAARAVRVGARLVIAWGGDGTMNEVACALAFGQTPLGLIPSGSGNGLALELGVSRTPRQAIVDAMNAVPRAIDAGEIGGRLFFNIAGIGFDAHVAACLDREHSRRGLSAYVRISMRELLRYRPLKYRIDGETTARPAVLVTLANSPQFGNGATIAPAAQLDDGRLDLVVFEESSRLGTILAAPRLFTGGVSKVRGARTRQLERVTIAADVPMMFHVDGEPVEGGTSIEGRVHAGALRICAPSGGPRSR